MRWALVLLATDSLHRVSSTTSFKSARIETRITTQKIKIEKTGRGRKSHQRGISTALASLHILPYTSLACDGSGASPQARTVLAGFIFVNLFFNTPCLGLHGGGCRERRWGGSSCRMGPGQPRSCSAPAGQVSQVVTFRCHRL